MEGEQQKQSATFLLHARFDIPEGCIDLKVRFSAVWSCGARRNLPGRRARLQPCIAAAWESGSFADTGLLLVVGIQIMSVI